MTRHRVQNPKTGRMVFKTGAIGRNLTKAKPQIKKVIKKVIKKPTNRPTGRTPKDTKGRDMKWDGCKGKWCSKKIGGPIKGKYYGYEGATKKPSALIKSAGKTKNFATRPSARAFFDRGDYGPVYYAGKRHIMAFRINGSPYWKEM